MSVILLEPPRPKNPNRFEDVVNAPLSACLFTGYIASVLRRQNITVEIVNARLHDWSIEQTADYLSQKAFSLLCVHVVYLWEKTQDIFDMLSVVKLKNKYAHVNLYGYYPTFAYKKILKSFLSIDSVTVGEPEFTTLDLARYILSKNETSPEISANSLSSKNVGERRILPFSYEEPGKTSGHPGKIPVAGLAFREKNGDIALHSRPPIQNLDQLPFPERQDIDLCKRKNITTYLQGSRGCYGHCTFCYLNPFYGQGNQWRGRSAKNIFEEMWALSTEHAINSFYFSDANFFGPGKFGKERAISLAELILDHGLNIRFGFECRVNDVDAHSLSKLVLAGLTSVFLGLESGDPVSLNRFKKHTTVDENRRAVQLLRDCGIEPTFGFIMFESNSTFGSIRNNLEFLKEVGIMATPAVTAHLLHHRQTLFEGTPDYQRMMCENADTDTSFTGYEMLYRIKDPKVEAFSEIISTFCRTTLSLLPKTFHCDEVKLSERGPGAVVSDTVNGVLIALFEKTLSDFEANAIDYDNPRILKEISQKLISKVEVDIQSLSESDVESFRQ